LRDAVKAYKAYKAATAPEPTCADCGTELPAFAGVAACYYRPDGPRVCERCYDERKAHKCADCGKPLPAGGFGVIAIQPAAGAVERLCSACFAKRQHARAERVLEAIKAHEGESVECQFAPSGPWVTGRYVTAGSDEGPDAIAARVTAIRWSWKCACQNCDGGHLSYKTFEEDDDG
jgi:hypothetical protein